MTNPTTTSFKDELLRSLKANVLNNYGADNYDENRFGKFKGRPSKGIRERISDFVHRKERLEPYNLKAESLYSQYGDKLEMLYSLLNKRDQRLLVQLIAYRLMGYTKVKLPLNTTQYWDNLEQVKNLTCSTEEIDPGFLGFTLQKFDLSSIGFDTKLFFTKKGVYTDFLIEQYAYKNGDFTIEVQKGDTVLDLGACWGDTALYFSCKTGKEGKVFSFEFIPGNVNLFKKNLSLNPQWESTIEIVQNAVSDKSNQVLYYNDYGPGSHVQADPFEGCSGTVTTLSVDDLVQQSKLERVDFIKMDIEGSEPLALEGALETIKKFKPTLAIAIYHSMEDLTNIPLWIDGLNLGYKLYLDHFTIHAEETILFAKVEP